MTNEVPQETRIVQRLDVETGEATTVHTYQADAPYPIVKDADGCYHIWRHSEKRWPSGAANNLETAMFLWASTMQELDAANSKLLAAVPLLAEAEREKPCDPMTPDLAAACDELDKAIRRLPYKEPTASSGVFCEGHRDGFTDAQIEAAKAAREFIKDLLPQFREIERLRTERDVQAEQMKAVQHKLVVALGKALEDLGALSYGEKPPTRPWNDCPLSDGRELLAALNITPQPSAAGGEGGGT